MIGVALIGHKRIPDRSGGVEVVVEELASRLAGRGFAVTAYNRCSKGQRSGGSFEGVRLVDIPTPANKNLNAVVYSYLATICAIASRADVIHYHALGPAASLWLAKLLGKRVVVTVHGLNYLTPKWKGLGAKYIKFGERLAAKKADETIVLSKSIQRYFEECYGFTPAYIPNGVSMPAEVDDDSILDRLGLRGSNFLLCVSRLVPGKGLETLVEAFRQVDTEADLIIAGDSDHVEDFKAGLKKLAATDSRIRFIGNVCKTDICALYAATRAFVFPSEAEGMPMSLLEALWFDCPCLVSDIPENTEVLDGHGLTFRVGDAEDLKEKLSALTQSFPVREDTRSLIVERHDWDRVVDETVKVYERVLA